MMLYLVIKSAHLLAVMTWISGMVAVALFLIRPSPAAISAFRQWDQYVTAPAMLVAWVLGLTLAYMGGWFGDAWLWAKLVLVVVLSGMHGALAGRLRRVSATRALPRHESYRWLGLMFCALAGVIFLVMAKPF
ncbi:CopD family protein [Thalassospira sp. NFXS8]